MVDVVVVVLVVGVEVVVVALVEEAVKEVGEVEVVVVTVALVVVLVRMENVVVDVAVVVLLRTYNCWHCRTLMSFWSRSYCIVSQVLGSDCSEVCFRSKHCIATPCQGCSLQDAAQLSSELVLATPIFPTLKHPAYT
jgi:hypothetical protein